jgi:hypothetical protein
MRKLEEYMASPDSSYSKYKLVSIGIMKRKQNLNIWKTFFLSMKGIKVYDLAIIPSEVTLNLG